MNGERFTEQYVSMSERYADALTELEEFEGQIKELVVGSSLGGDVVLIPDPEFGADALTASGILEARAGRIFSPEEIRQTYAEYRELLRTVFDHRGQLYWREVTKPDDRHDWHNPIWRFNHDFVLGVIPENIAVTYRHKTAFLHLPSMVSSDTTEVEEFTAGNVELEDLKQRGLDSVLYGRGQLCSYYAVPEGKKGLTVPYERMLIGDEAVLKRMTELFLDPLLLESDSPYTNRNYLAPLKYLLQSGKVTEEMLAELRVVFTEQYQRHSADYESTIQSRDNWADRVRRSIPKTRELRILYEDAKHDLEITASQKFGWGRLLGIVTESVETAPTP
jgi:hypothetical protein